MSQSALDRDTAVRAFLGLGTNIGNAQQKSAILRQAIEALEAHVQVRIIRSSSIYRSEPWGYSEQPDFANAVVEIETDLPAPVLLQLLLQTEESLGRKPTFRWGPRLIDIDILLYGVESVDLPELQIPHPQLLHRSFAVIPLLEISRDAKLPDGRLVRSACDKFRAEELRIIEKL